MRLTSPRNGFRSASVGMFYPKAKERPANERENKRHDSDEQVFPQPGQNERFAMGRLAEGAIREYPTGMQPDREPEGSGPEPGIGQNAADHKEGEKPAREQHRVAELTKGMRDRIETGEPADGVVRRGCFRGLEEMHDREKGRGEQERAEARETAQENAEDEAAEKQLLQNRHQAGREEHVRHLVPKKSAPQRIDVEGNDDRTAAEQGNGRDHESHPEVGPGAGVFLQPQIAPAPHLQDPEERPKERHSRDEQGAMEIAFEIKLLQAWQEAMGDDSLAEPEERGSEERPEEDDAGEIKEESGRVFQEC